MSDIELLKKMGVALGHWTGHSFVANRQLQPFVEKHLDVLLGIQSLPTN